MVPDEDSEARKTRIDDADVSGNNTSMRRRKKKGNTTNSTISTTTATTILSPNNIPLISPPTTSSSSSPNVTIQYTLDKIRQINTLLRSHDNYHQLAALAHTPNGYVNNGLRRRVYARLLNCDTWREGLASVLSEEEDRTNGLSLGHQKHGTKTSPSKPGIIQITDAITLNKRGKRKSIRSTKIKGHNHDNVNLEALDDALNSSLDSLLDMEDRDSADESAGFAQHRDYMQAQLDVNRSFIHYPTNLSKQDRAIYQRRLTNIIMTVLGRHPYLHYYQGFHDVCSVLLIILGEELATMVAEILALFWLRDFMHPTLDPVMSMLSLIGPIFKKTDSDLYKFFASVTSAKFGSFLEAGSEGEEDELGILPYFALSWVLSWTSHELKNVESIARIFDFFIVSNPIMPVYFAIALVSESKQFILNSFSQSKSGLAGLFTSTSASSSAEHLEPDFSTLHSFLKNLLANTLDDGRSTQQRDNAGFKIDVEAVIQKAQRIFEKYPPNKVLMKGKKRVTAQEFLGKWSTVTRFDQDVLRVLKTNDHARLDTRIVGQIMAECEKEGQQRRASEPGGSVKVENGVMKPQKKYSKLALMSVGMVVVSAGAAYIASNYGATFS